jgi:two-component system sensor histidine kinase VicK
VTDTGMGIPKAAQPQIFTKFYRASNVVRQETTGTGLGLYLVKGLIDALGGKIWFESTENHGSTFYVRLPRVYVPKGDTQFPERLPRVHKPPHKRV